MFPIRVSETRFGTDDVSPSGDLAFRRNPRGHSAGIRGRRGLSLLEVMLALAVLGLSLATIGELMRIGSRNAEMARDLTTAQILCETKVSEIVTGMLHAITTAPAPIIDAGSGNDWLYAVETQQVGVQGLLAIHVIVQQNPDLVSRPASFGLFRWIVDPNSQTTGGSTTSGTGSSSSTSF